MFGFVIVIHALACALLIVLVLIQQGRGGGLIDSLSSAESIFGTRTNTFLIKATSVLAVVFFMTCLGLAFLSIQKNKSLIDTSYKQTSSAPARPLGVQTSAPSDQKAQEETATAGTTPAAPSPAPATDAQTPAPPAAGAATGEPPALETPAAPSVSAPADQPPAATTAQPTSAEGGSNK